MAIKPIKPVTLGNVAKAKKASPFKPKALTNAQRLGQQTTLRTSVMPAVRWRAPQAFPYGTPAGAPAATPTPYDEIGGYDPLPPPYGPATTPPPGPAPAPAPAAEQPAPAPPVTVGPGGRTYLKWNPQLPAHPLGAYTDAEYLASEAALKTGTIADYQDILREIGYESPEGQFMRGSLEVQAELDQNEQDRLLNEAVTSLTNEMRDAGTLFSGYRGTEEARRTQPMTTEKGRITSQLGIDLAKRLGDALSVWNSYTLERNKLLAEAAGRGAEAAEESPVGEPKPPATEPAPAPAKKPAPKPAAKPKPKPKPKPAAKKPPPPKKKVAPKKKPKPKFVG